MTKWMLILLLPALSQASVVKVQNGGSGWQLLVDSQPYIVRGVGYLTDKVGQDPNIGNYEDWMIQDDNHNGIIDGPYESWVDANRNNVQDPSEPTVGDFALLKAMGVNTIRIYHHPSANPVIMACYPPATNPQGNLSWNHATNVTLLRDLYTTYGIRSAMGDEAGAYTVGSCADYAAGTDYTNSVQIASMTASITDMVNTFKNEPWLLMYVLGNENNYDFTHTNAFSHPTEYYTFIGNMVDLIHSLDPNHPVALSDGEDQFINYVSSYAPHLDIYGVNSYRNPGALTGFGTLWTEVRNGLNKPLLITEYGLTAPHFITGGHISDGSIYDEDYQNSVVMNYWNDIQAHTAGNTSPRNSIGGFDYSWIDSWWQNGDPNNLYINPGDDLEVSGIAGQGSGANSVFERQIKKVYGSFARAFAGTASCNCSVGP